MNDFLLIDIKYQRLLPVICTDWTSVTNSSEGPKVDVLNYKTFISLGETNHIILIKRSQSYQMVPSHAYLINGGMMRKPRACCVWYTLYYFLEEVFPFERIIKTDLSHSSFNLLAILLWWLAVCRSWLPIATLPIPRGKLWLGNWMPYRFEIQINISETKRRNIIYKNRKVKEKLLRSLSDYLQNEQLKLPTHNHKKISGSLCLLRFGQKYCIRGKKCYPDVRQTLHLVQLLKRVYILFHHWKCILKIIKDDRVANFWHILQRRYNSCPSVSPYLFNR